MKKVFGLILALAMCCFVLVGCDSSDSSSDSSSAATGTDTQSTADSTAADTNTQQTSFQGLSFAIPTTWQISEAGSDEDTLYYNCANDGDDVFIQYQASEYSLEDMSSQIVDEFKQGVDNFKLIDSGMKNNGNQDYFRIDFTGSINDKSGTYTMCIFETTGGVDLFMLHDGDETNDYTTELDNFINSVKASN